ncbi:MAG: hypothetical protein IJF07_03615 [Lachnospiraceae bacterium]|nr:hypothetical protein [Lachnospiraceae bacterium]
MQESIKRILEGNFEGENGSLDFSCTKIELSLLKGSIYEGSFRIISSQGFINNGFVTSSDIRMECLNSEFSGTDVEIAYCFHGENMEDGDVAKGVFSIVSSQGEYYLPFIIRIEPAILESSVGEIKNLFHFANLAKSDWQEALNLFYSQGFEQVFQGEDEQFLDCYRALSAKAYHGQNMEEFLIQINKKYPVEFVIEKNQLTLELPLAEGAYAVTETGVDIARNGWGYTALNVECEGDFVFTETEYLTEEDFLGNYYRLPVYIDTSLCRKGKNFGTIFLYNSYVTIELPVMVRLGETKAGKHLLQSRKHIVIQLMEFYQAFRLKKIGTDTWLKETGKLVERLVSMDDKDVSAMLFQAQLLITDGRENEAGWILDQAVEQMELEDRKNSTLWAYYLYLTTLLHRQESYSNQVAEEVERIYRRYRHDWRLAWLLLYLSEEYNKSAVGKWLFLEKQFGYGCTSPVLYIEALYLINNNPAILRKLERFELQVLYYGVRQEVLGPETIEQILYLSEKTKEYSPVLLKLLMKLYEKEQDTRILHKICVLLIKNARTGKDYFIWYRRGIEAQLRITNLYEYYMMSVDLQEVQALPKIVLMYFAYQNNLDYERSAFLYAYVIQHKEEYAELYESYKARIENFAITQMQKEHMNQHLAVIYKEVLLQVAITEQMAGALAKLLFAYEICVEDTRIRRVLVYQKGNCKPRVYSLQNGVAWISLYGRNNTIVFEDDWGNRFMQSVEYTLDRLMFPDKYIKEVEHYVGNLPELDVYLASTDKLESVMTKEGLERYKRLAVSEEVSLWLRRKAYMKLLHYYYEEDDIVQLDEHLNQLPPKELLIAERASVMRFMVLRGKYETVYEWIKLYGPYFVEPKILQHFVTEMIQHNHFAEDVVLMAAAIYAFKKGRHDSVLTGYLCEWFCGLSKDMRDIWKVARSYGIECYDFCERLLLQMLYTKSFVPELLEIFQYYVTGEPRQEVIDAVLAQCAYEYLVREKSVEEYIFTEIGQAVLAGADVQYICKLAFLKYYAENKQQLTEDMFVVAEALLQDMMRRQIHLNFFREYKEFDYLLKDMCDKTIVEYHIQSGARARIHYMILQEDGKEEEYAVEYMEEVYSGLCAMEFVLFFGEILQYYIVEEYDDTEQVTESGSIQKSDIVNGATGSKYELINNIAMSKAMQDTQALECLLEEYHRKEYLNETLFVLR